MSDINLTPEILVSRLGDYLVEKNLITADDLQQALDYQATLPRDGKRPLIGQILVQMGFIDRTGLDQAVTEQILKLRAALEDANAQLERRVQARTAELQQALNRLSELNRLKSQFVSNISHELRTPLAHLKGYLDLLADGELGSLDAEQSRAIGVMVRSSDRLAHLIEDLLMFSMQERGEVTLRLSTFNLRNITSDLLNRLASKAEEKQIILFMECDVNAALVEADQEKMVWVISQLLDNAIKFTPSHGRVVLRITSEMPYYRVSVEDTGIGIPADKLEEIFEPFHQLDGSSTRRYGGTGLGLALTRRIIEAHGSVITVSSTVNQGTTLEFLVKSSPATG